MKIYTKTGDLGSTSLFSGERVSKDSSYIEAYGTVDELNAFIGFAAAISQDKELLQIFKRIQNDLHSVCADLATPHDAKNASKVERLSSDLAKHFEKLMDDFEKELPPLNQFILAGGTELASRLHLARTVARRAERTVIAHSQKEKLNSEIIIYLNRLSDLLFVLARIANKRAAIPDVFWQKKK